ncbi:hypothetical protein [uncultured Demequina sp.]|uniref:hypothetical protein n=1 Tax=uncultured Demequina sp. TaxID=693499 RepID=UPI0025D4AEA7|nr:hypothetical protein [uncultured Demequina sp.]
MAEQVRVLFLHGINSAEVVDWRTPLNEALADCQRSPVELTDAVEPHYDDLLSTGAGDEGTLPLEATDRVARSDFAARQSVVAHRIAGARFAPGRGPLDDATLEKVSVAAFPMFAQVRAFLAADSHPTIIRRVLHGLGNAEGDWVVIAHSLGTAVALELLGQLPERMNIKLLLTLGSPLGRQTFRKFAEKSYKHANLAAVEAWVNVYNSLDFVPNAGGIGGPIPEAVNLALNGRFRDHGVAHALQQPQICREIGNALYGVRERGVVPSREGPDRDEWSGSDLLTAVTMQHSYRIEMALQTSPQRGAKDKRERVRGIREWLASQALKAAEDSGSRPIFNDLDRDMKPWLHGRVAPEQIPMFLVHLYRVDPLLPFSVDYSKVAPGVRRQVAMDFGILENYVDIVESAVDEVKTVGEEQGRAVKRVATLATAVVLAGVAVVAAPFLAVAAAPAGLAGGAAFLAGLSALGPGGIAGGLMVVGGVAGVGSGAAVTLGRTLGAQSSEAVLAGLRDLLAARLVAERIGVDTAPGFEWVAAGNALIEATDELLAFEELNDSSGQGKKLTQDAKKKVDGVQRLMEWMVTRGMVPPDSVMIEAEAHSEGA